ncbi:hypothetical protein B7P43_G16277 [Cryptotermes secundus]|uniref:Kinesin motor domain-containing protein n=1 Tax=Cryptotermes secundus TaxID=105785 RepID=A0A2J7QE48_9NEOP|nr:kinesin-like protein KIF23 isoform X2 [Cryptotermes secundus]PNF26855.1 hypothetical protein B7P43_G16277 [Cryptotermes secundus]
MLAMYCKKSSKNVQAKCQQMRERGQIKFFCRIRSMENDSDISCIKVLSDKIVSLTPPSTSVGFQTGNYREIHCLFHRVFEEDASQETVFEWTTIPLINDVFRGKSCLLFAYGLSGGGKTYTMNGEPRKPGIISRALDVIFNNIMHFQAEKFVFKPDKMNGFEVQAEEDAWKERQCEAHRTQRLMKYACRTDDAIECDQQAPCYIQLEGIDEDNIYAIFISYVEVYKNAVYDLLEDTRDYGKHKRLQGKLVREDRTHDMYVHDVVEVEVKSSKEAHEILYKGMCTKRKIFGSVTSGFSCSHSVFTIRIVQAVLDQFGGAPEQKGAYCVSKLCLVDLAGSKCTNYMKNTSQRLGESGNINNSLMTLKTCLEILHENQKLGMKKLIPYRDSKLTYLFKNFFEGESNIHALICVNPRAANFDETLHVMKFANILKEVQVLHQSSTVKSTGFPVGRRRANQMFQEALQKLEQDERVQSSDDICSISTAFPCLELKDPMDDKLIHNLIQFLEFRHEQYNLQRQNLVHKEKEFFEHLKAVMQKNFLAQHENTSLHDILDFETNKRIALEAKENEMESCAEQLRQELYNRSEAIKMVKQELMEKKMQLLWQVLENKQTAQKYHIKLTAEMGEVACSMEYLQSEQEARLKAVVVHEAQNGVEMLKKPLPLASFSRRKRSVTSPIISSEDENSTSAMA